MAIRKPVGSRRGGVDLGEDQEGTYEYTSWRWWPTWEALKSHHCREIGYIACSIQLFGATLFSWCGLVSIPGISESIHSINVSKALANGRSGDKWTSDATWYGGYW